MTKLFSLVAGSLCVIVGAAGGDWDHLGPWNILDDKDGKGEAGTIASAASSAAQPNIIYAGGSNNGASSGILKTVDGGVHWTRNSNGLWDTRILGTWIHPDDPSSDHVFVGTESGIYESTDGAASWKLREETKTFGNVMSFREGVIGDEKYIFANSQHGILTLPYVGGTWKRIDLPEGVNTLAHNAELSVVTTNGITEAVMCSGEWNGGSLYYLEITSPTNGTWSAPIGDPEPVNCCNVAVDPNDRNHLLFTNASEYQAYESKDAGKTSVHLPTPGGVFFVMIDQKNTFYTSTQAGAFVSYNEGKNWSEYQVVVHPRSGSKTIVRGPHDYQRIIPYFRGDGIAHCSDQGLHIVNGTNVNLTSAVGDMNNAITLGLSVSPGDADGPRKLVVTMWDWSSAGSWDDGKTWASWDLPAEKDVVNPNTGEGGGTTNLGSGGHTLMWHRNSYWHSDNGGKNLTRETLAEGSLEDPSFFRKTGSRTEPSGTVFSLTRVDDATEKYEEQDTEDSPDSMDEENMYTESMELESGDSTRYILVSEDFGVTFPVNHTMPDSLQDALTLTADPTSSVLFVVSPTCLAYSSDKGANWGKCIITPTAGPAFSGLEVISSKVMFLMRGTAVPLRTTDGGQTFTELTSAAPMFKYAGLRMSISWSGKTIVLYGSDKGAITRGEYGTQVWKSTDNGDSWTDETGDLVTISLGRALWYEKDLYITSGGEGVIRKKNLEA